MAFTQLVSGMDNGSVDYAEFLCDEVADLDNLPNSLGKPGNECSVGSKAIVLGNRQIYILSNNNEWVFYRRLDSIGSGSSEGGSIDVTSDGNGNVTIL